MRNRILDPNQPTCGSVFSEQKKSLTYFCLNTKSLCGKYYIFGLLLVTFHCRYVFILKKIILNLSTGITGKNSIIEFKFSQLLWQLFGDFCLLDPHPPCVHADPDPGGLHNADPDPHNLYRRIVNLRLHKITFCSWWLSNFVIGFQLLSFIVVFAELLI